MKPIYVFAGLMIFVGCAATRGAKSMSIGEFKDIMVTACEKGFETAPEDLASITCLIGEEIPHPFTPEQTLWEFENLLVRTGQADEKWLNIAERLKDERSQEPEEEQAVEMLDIAKEFHVECENVQEQLTASN